MLALFCIKKDKQKTAGFQPFFAILGPKAIIDKNDDENRLHAGIATVYCDVLSVYI